jgi:two-component system LytT family response regulator
MRGMKIRALIVDDEPLARERLRTLLEGEPDIEVVGECADGQQAVATIKQVAPDLVFLDIQMPELDGFGVLAQLEGTRLPVVVFVTAHDRFALKAFEVHALDYLLKPFDRARFQKTLRRALESLRQNRPEQITAQLSALLSDIRPPAKYLERLAVKSSGKVVFLKVEDLDWIEAADNYVDLHWGNESLMHRETMSALEQQLPPNKFMRISRSSIVNVDRIKELQPLFHGEYAVILRNGVRLTLSRTYRDKLSRMLG